LLVSREAFDEMIARELDALPPEFAGKMENVEVASEDWPSEEEMRAMGLSREEVLAGLYVGVPLDRRRTGYSSLPDRITLYRAVICAGARSRTEIRRRIRETLLHEIGHHFGLGEEDLP